MSFTPHTTPDHIKSGFRAHYNTVATTLEMSAPPPALPPAAPHRRLPPVKHQPPRPRGYIAMMQQ